MNLINLLVVLVIVCLLIYLVESLLPIDVRIKRVIEVIICIGILIYLLSSFGLVSAEVALIH